MYSAHFGHLVKIPISALLTIQEILGHIDTLSHSILVWTMLSFTSKSFLNFLHLFLISRSLPTYSLIKKNREIFLGHYLSHINHLDILLSKFLLKKWSGS